MFGTIFSVPGASENDARNLCPLQSESISFIAFPVLRIRTPYGSPHVESDRFRKDGVPWSAAISQLVAKHGSLVFCPISDPLLSQESKLLPRCQPQLDFEQQIGHERGIQTHMAHTCLPRYPKVGSKDFHRLGDSTVGSSRGATSNSELNAPTPGLLRYTHSLVYAPL